MLKRAFRFTASTVILALAFSLANPASAGSYTSSNTVPSDSVPVILDALIMRPVGFAVMCAGFATWSLAVPLMAITRPTEMHKPFKSLVILPARFTFVDRLGTHPDRRGAERDGTIR